MEKQSHDSFDRTNKRGIKNQVANNPNKAQYLATYLELYGAESLDYLTSGQLITLMVSIGKIDAKEYGKVDYSKSIGEMIEADRKNGNYKGRD